MLKLPFTYEDFDGNEVTDTLYFNLTKTEIIDLELGYDGGIEKFIERVVKAEDLKTLINEFKNIVLLSYGERTDDGKRFIKSDRIKEEFSQTAAFDSLFMRLAQDDDFAATFIKGLLPQDLVKEIEKDQKKEVVNTPPLPPQT